MFLVRVLIDVDCGERIAAACLRVARHLVCEHVAFHIDVDAVLEEAGSVSDGAIDAHLFATDEGADDLTGSIERIRFCLGVTCDGISDVVSLNESVLCIDRDGRMRLGHVMDLDPSRLIRHEQDD